MWHQFCMCCVVSGHRFCPEFFVYVYFDSLSSWTRYVLSLSRSLLDHSYLFNPRSPPTLMCLIFVTQSFVLSLPLSLSPSLSQALILFPFLFLIKLGVQVHHELTTKPSPYQFEKLHNINPSCARLPSLGESMSCYLLLLHLHHHHFLPV